MRTIIKNLQRISFVNMLYFITIYVWLKHKKAITHFNEIKSLLEEKFIFSKQTNCTSPTTVISGSGAQAMY